MYYNWYISISYFKNISTLHDVLPAKQTAGMIVKLVYYDLLVLYVPCEQRSFASPRKTETSCISTKNVMCPHEKIRHYYWNLLLHLKLQIEVVIYADVSENRLPETKIAFVGSTYPGQRPQCPSVSPHFLLIYVTRLSVYLSVYRLSVSVSGLCLFVYVCLSACLCPSACLSVCLLFNTMCSCCSKLSHTTRTTGQTTPPTTQMLLTEGWIRAKPRPPPTGRPASVNSA